MKLNRKGFTLIELLAVITIMGILMLVAIPAISRTIENSRRDTFADIALEYVNAVRNGVLADNISCCTTAVSGATTCSVDTVASALPGEGTSGTDYYFPIITKADSTNASNMSDFVQSTTDIMEKGGKSPFGNAEVYGYVKFNKKEDTTSGKTVTTYSIALVDSGKHGFENPLVETAVKRGSVNTTNQKITTVSTVLNGKKLCKVN